MDGCEENIKARKTCPKLSRCRLVLLSAGLTSVSVAICVLREFYPLLMRNHRISHGLGFLHVRCNRVSSVSKASVKLLMSFFSVENSPPPYWLNIANHTMQNHIAFSNRTGVPYIRATRGHARCGKLRRVLEQLVLLPESAWLFFVDADVGMTCNLHVMSATEYVARWHAAVFRYDSLDVDMLVMIKFGVFAVRNSEWSRDYLHRLANSVESRMYLCRLTLPENWAFHAVTTQSDYCHIHEVSEVAKKDPELFVKGPLRPISFVHLTGSEQKREPDRFLRTVRDESLCLSGQLNRSRNFTFTSGYGYHFEFREIYDPGNLIPRNITVNIEAMDGPVYGFHVVLISAFTACPFLGWLICRRRHGHSKLLQ